METRIVLNPSACSAADLEQFTNELTTELNSAEGITKYSTVKGKPPPKTLPLETVSQIVIEHGGEILLFAKAIVELVTAIIKRRGIKDDKDNPPAMLASGDESLAIPASKRQIERFAKNVEANLNRAQDED